MSAGGGAEVEPAIAHRAQERRYDLLLAVVKHIPKRHRIGWLHALARRYVTPFTAEPTAAELDYLAWSEARHTSPKAKAKAEGNRNPAHANASSPGTLTIASIEQAHNTHINT